MVYKSGFRNFFILLVLFDSMVLLATQLFSEIDTATILVLVIMNIFTLLHTFARKRPIEIEIDNVEETIKIRFFHFPYFFTSRAFKIDNLTFRYQKELVGRTAKEYILRGFNSKGDTEFILSPELFWWDSEIVNEITKQIKKICNVDVDSQSSWFKYDFRTNDSEEDKSEL